MAGLEYYVLNPESLKNGQITTDTQIAWLWSYNGKNYSYDPDGDPITGYYFAGIPKGYVLGMLKDNSGTPFGFVTQCSDARHYDLQFQVADGKGAFSNVVVYSFDVVNVEDYTSFTGTFQSKDEVQTHSVTIDFSKTPSVAVCLVRTDFKGVTADIKDSGNNIVKTINIDGDTGNQGYSGSSWVTFSKPSGSPDVCNYSVDVKPLGSDTGSYTLSVGSSDYIEAMISGVKNSVPVSYYAESMGTYKKTTNKNNVCIINYNPNKKESFYKFTGAGEMTISALSDDPNLRFKILNSELQSLYDSNTDNNAHRTKCLTNRQACEKVKVTTQQGETYYLVLYTPKALQTTQTTYQGGCVYLTVGEPALSVDGLHITIPSVSATRTDYSQYVPFTISDVPSTASPYRIDVIADSDKLGNWDIKRSDSDTVYSGYCISKTNIPYDWDSNQHLKLSGTWYFRYLSRFQTSTIQPKILFTYLYEIGD